MSPRCACSALGTLVLLALGAPATAAAPRLQVRHYLPVVEERYYEPSQPPLGLPPMSPIWAAATQCFFTVNPHFAVVDRFNEAGDGTCQARSRVTEAQLDLTLKVVSWVPRDSSHRVVDHEEAHRQICLRVYAGAREAAQEAAEQVLGRTFESVGASCAEASEAAIEGNAVEELRREFDARSTEVARQVGNYFDVLSDLGMFGSNLDPTPQIALAGALQWLDHRNADDAAQSPMARLPGAGGGTVDLDPWHAGR